MKPPANDYSYCHRIRRLLTSTASILSVLLLHDGDSGRRSGWDDAGIGLPYSWVSVKHISVNQVTLKIKRLCVQNRLKE